MFNIMLSRITEIDRYLFQLINQELQHPFLDRVMPIITDFGIWMWPLITAWLALFIFGGTKGRRACCVLLVTVLFVDNFTSYILKPWFGRLRPNVALETTRVLGRNFRRLPSPSFPSGHAVNVFAMATVLSLYYRKLFAVWFLGAAIVGYSRVYIGVHYPMDIIAGAFVGIMCTLIIIYVARYIGNLFMKRSRKQVNNTL